MLEDDGTGNRISPVTSVIVIYHCERFHILLAEALKVTDSSSHTGALRISDRHIFPSVVSTADTPDGVKIRLSTRDFISPGDVPIFLVEQIRTDQIDTRPSPHRSCLGYGIRQSAGCTINPAQLPPFRKPLYPAAAVASAQGQVVCTVGG